MMEAVEQSVRRPLKTSEALTALSHRVLAFAQVTHAIALLDGSLAYGLGGVIVAVEEEEVDVAVEGTGLILVA